MSRVLVFLDDWSDGMLPCLRTISSARQNEPNLFKLRDSDLAALHVCFFRHLVSVSSSAPGGDHTLSDRRGPALDRRFPLPMRYDLVLRNEYYLKVADLDCALLTYFVPV